VREPPQPAWTPLWTSKTFTINNVEPGCYNLMVVLPFGCEGLINQSAAAATEGRRSC
jgi:hypothetical protein